MKGPSRHLSWKELACKDGTPYPHEWKVNRAANLALAFESIRAAAGNKPIQVLSAFRTFSWNRKVGGAKNSQHLEGRALDLKPPIGMTVYQFQEIIMKLVKDTDIRGIGLYPTFVHIDIRPVNRLVRWKANGVKDSINQ